MPSALLHAYIDEAGQRSRSKGSSDHFVMSAVVVPDENLANAQAWLARLRSDLGRGEGHVLHRHKIKQHSYRLHAARSLGSQEWATISAVVVCKRHLTAGELNDDQAYLYTLRYLLERLSWLARDRGRVLDYTMAHIVRFKMEKLRAYEARLRDDPWCQIAWGALDPKGGRLDQPRREELLQLADIAASSILDAFEPDQFGNTEPRYLQELTPRLYRRNGNLTSYGLKMHPWRNETRAAYPFVAALSARRPAGAA